MKKTFFFLLLATFVTQAQAQKIKAKDVPAPVMDAFKKSYPDIQKTYWGKDSIHYHVAFYTGKAPMSVTYDSTGKIVIAEMQMPVEELPSGIVEYVQKNYPGEIFKDVAQITDEKGIVTYEIEVKDMDLVFDAKGNLISSEKCYD